MIFFTLNPPFIKDYPGLQPARFFSLALRIGLLFGHSSKFFSDSLFFGGGFLLGSFFFLGRFSAGIWQGHGTIILGFFFCFLEGAKRSIFLCMYFFFISSTQNSEGICIYHRHTTGFCSVLRFSPSSESHDTLHSLSTGISILASSYRFMLFFIARHRETRSRYLLLLFLVLADIFNPTENHPMTPTGPYEVTIGWGEYPRGPGPDPIEGLLRLSKRQRFRLLKVCPMQIPKRLPAFLLIICSMTHILII